jgi:two-component sensor histidine kinase
LSPIAAPKPLSIRWLFCSRRRKTFRSREWSSIGDCSIQRDGSATSSTATPIRQLERSCSIGVPGRSSARDSWTDCRRRANILSFFPRYVRVFTTGETSEAEYELGGRWYRSTAAKLGDGLVVTVQDVSTRRRAEDAQRLRLEELNHRVKNLLASVIAMADVSERGATSTAEFRNKLSARLLALSRAHSLLMAGAWTDAAVEDVVKNTLEPYLTADAGRFHIEGPRIGVSPDVALALNMALHELATNAIKYGALSNQRGQIEIRWGLDPDRPHFALLIWTESDGPPVSKPNGGGFGTRLLQRAFAATDGQVKLHFFAGGLFCEMRFAGVAGGLTGALEAGQGPALEETSPDEPG